MKNTIKLLLFAAVLLIPAVVFAQGSGTIDSQPRPSVNDGVRNDDNFVVTRSTKGEIVGIKDGILTIKIKDDKEIRIALTKETKFKLGKNSLDADELDANLFKEGRKVKITYQPIENNRTKIDKIAILVNFEADEKDKQKPKIG